MTHHLFFDLDGWTAIAEKTRPVYVMPIQTTKSGKRGIVWKEERIQLSQIQPDQCVWHCSFLEGRWIENFDSDQERQARHAHFNQRYQQLKAWLERAGFPVVEGLVSFPKSTTTVDTYLPKYVTEAENAAISS